MFRTGAVCFLVIVFLWVGVVALASEVNVGCVKALAFFPDGNLAVAVTLGVEVREVPSLGEVKFLRAQTGFVTCMALSPEGELIHGEDHFTFPSFPGEAQGNIAGKEAEDSPWGDGEKLGYSHKAHPPGGGKNLVDSFLCESCPGTKRGRTKGCGSPAVGTPEPPRSEGEEHPFPGEELVVYPSFPEFPMTMELSLLTERTESFRFHLYLEGSFV
ncbi:hypothetical protein M15_04460 [Atrimonas thermophila]